MIESLKIYKENFDYLLEQLIKENEDKDKEIERLKNIINELEKEIQNFK